MIQKIFYTYYYAYPSVQNM